MAGCRQNAYREQAEELLRQHRPLQGFPRPDDVLASRKPYHIPSLSLENDD